MRRGPYNRYSMVNMLQHFQSDCLLLSPQLLIPIGIIVAFSGICIWLGGLRFNWFAGMFMAGVIAAIVPFVIPIQLLTQMFVFTIVIAASTGIFLNHPTMIFTGGLCLAVIALWIFACATGASSDLDLTKIVYGYEEPLGFKESAIVFGTYIKFFLINILHLFSSLSIMYKIIPAVICIAVIFVGIIAQRVVAAFACSVFGVGMIFFGMITLLLYKGSQPLVVIHSKSTFYIAVAVCMIVFGMVSELVLCPFKVGKCKKKEEKKTS